MLVSAKDTVSAIISCIILICRHTGQKSQFLVGKVGFQAGDSVLSEGDCSWITEQAMHEIYLKSFELAVRAGKSRNLMTSTSRIGNALGGRGLPHGDDYLRNW